MIILFVFLDDFRSGYNCVIYGWDPKCTMSLEWITTMRVNQLPNGPNQPFYNVLVQDGTCRYAAQGTDTPGWLWRKHDFGGGVANNNKSKTSKSL